MFKHRCHAIACKQCVPPRMFMCLKHWRMVPRDLQKEVWRNYTPGQEITKSPTAEYLLIAKQAVEHVAIIEGKNND